MSREFTKENALESYQSLIQAVTDFQIKRLNDENGYKAVYNWIINKCNIILSESTFTLPCESIPGKISKFIYDYLYPNKQSIIDTYYKFDSNNNQYVLNARKSNIPNEDINTIINSTVLRQGNVIWVEFGYNIGAEFGEKHPAVIIKNCDKTLIVIPLSSQSPTFEKVNALIPQVYNFPLKNRWANVTRITPIRVDFNSKIGSVNNSVLKEISNKLKENGIK